MIFPTSRVTDLPGLGREVEDLGFESIWLPDHSHIPVKRESPYPGAGELPFHYSSWVDPFVGLGVIAAVTDRLRLGTSVCLVIERDPITLAKEVASLDFLSHGRFLFGIGAGWNREEMANHGTDFKIRFSLMRERVEAMKTIWTTDEAEYHGRFVNFDPIWQWPKPVQRPNPPILIGGTGPKVLDRVVQYADGWLPTPLPNDPNIIDRIAELQRLAEAAGRLHLPVTVLLFGRPNVRWIEQYQKAGVERCVFAIPEADQADVRQRIQATAEALKGFGLGG